MGTQHKLPEEVLVLMEHALKKAPPLIQHLSRTHETPFAALVTCMFAAAGIAKTLGMPAESLAEGISSAYKSIDLDDSEYVQ